MLKPKGPRILVRPDPVEKTFAGTIVKPDSVVSMEEKAARTGIVLDIGSTAWKNTEDGIPWAKIGDRIFFKQYSAATFNDKHATEWIINDEDVLAVIEETNTEVVITDRRPSAKGARIN